MVVYVIVNNRNDKKYLECVSAKNYEDVVEYCNKKYGKDSQPLAQPIILDTKGNPVHLMVEYLVTEEGKKR